MKYKEEVVQAAMQGLKEGGTMTPEAYKKLLEIVYQAGYNQKTRESLGAFTNK